MSDFERAHTFTAAFEGGYSNHPADRGGETNRGITKANWVSWCREQGIPQKPMRDITEADALPFYRARYWEPYATQYPWPLSAAAYDIAVNHGPGNLAYMMRFAAGRTPLLRALSLCDSREQFYRGIIANDPSQSVFKNGWMRRVNAQRRWLKENTEPENPRVLLVPKGGGDPVEWDGKPAKYGSVDGVGGVDLSPALIAQLRTVYPTPGTYTYEGLRIYIRRSGDMVLERATPPAP